MRICDRCGDCFDDDYDVCAADGVFLTQSFRGPRTLAGRYRLERKLAAGAMGQVFEAVHLAVGSRVAVKVMQPNHRDVRVALQRFHKEARILGAVKHPNAVLITDFDVDHRPTGAVAFLVTELLRGRSLAKMLDDKRTLTIAEVERLVVPLCEAVDEAHALGIIHRDIKPSNVFLERLRDGSEVVKVLDFGIAKLLARSGQDVPAPVAFDFDDHTLSGADQQLRDEILSAIDDDDDTSNEAPTADGRAPTPREGQAIAPPEGRAASTYAGLMVGTVPYMAAEQMVAEGVSRRTDVHAIAVLIFEMLSGHLPFEGDDDEIIRAKLADERPSLRELAVEVDVELDALLQRCFASHPDERPDRCAVLASAVSAAASRAVGEEPDPIGALALRLSTLARALGRLGPLAIAEDGEALIRDLLLSAGAGLPAVRTLLRQARPLVSAPPQRDLLAAQLELDDAIVAARATLGGLFADDADAGHQHAFQQLLLMWRRFDDVCTEAASLFEIDQGGDAKDPLALAWGSVLEGGPSGSEQVARPLVDVAAALLSRDPLVADDALAELLGERGDEVLRVLGAQDPADDETRVSLLAGLWRHADAVLLRDVGAERGAVRFVPFLAAQPGQADRFGRVVAMLRDRRGVDVLLGLDTSDDDHRTLLRCCLLHPVSEVRSRAIQVLPLSDLWVTIAHARTPLAVLAQICAVLLKRGVADHLKVFFFCVRESIAASSTSELREAVFMVRAFFEVPAFHEDALFEPLVELDRALRGRADAAGLFDESYARAVAVFMRDGAHDEAQLEHLRDVPLALQRKLAREGRFLATFVCHGNDRVALETLPHLLRLDDITRYLRLVTINRLVLVELAKRRRFFKKDATKIALLTNPKTPVGLARGFVGLIPTDQLRTLLSNRAMNADIRRLVQRAVGT